MSDLLSDPLTRLAAEKWRTLEPGADVVADPELLRRIYREELGGGRRPFPRARLQILELSGFLELYIWPSVPKPAAGAAAADAVAASLSHELLLCAALLITEKDRTGVDVWAGASERPWAVSAVLAGLMLTRERGLPGAGSATASTSSSSSASACSPSAPLSDSTKKADSQSVEPLTTVEAGTVLEAITVASRSLETKSVRHTVVRPVLLLERHLELFRELLLQRATRHFFRAVVVGRLLLPRLRACALWRRPLEGKLFRQLTQQVAAAVDMDVDEASGEALSPEDAAAAQYERLQGLQRLAYLRYRPALDDLALASVGSIARREDLAAHLDRLSDAALHDVAVRLCLVPPPAQWQETSDAAKRARRASEGVTDEEDEDATGAAGTDKLVDRKGQLLPAAVAALLDSGSATKASSAADEAGGDGVGGVPNPQRPTRALLLSAILDAHAARPSSVDALNASPLFPSEALLFDADRLPFPAQARAASSIARPLALPRLNLAFLTLSDLLTRNYELFRLESAYAIRDDVIEAVRRLQPQAVSSVSAAGRAESSTRFVGWSKMALPLPPPGLRIIDVKPPRLGDEHPAAVRARLDVDLSAYAPHIREEWDSLREGDAIFLLGIVAPPAHEVEAIDEEDRRQRAAAQSHSGGSSKGGKSSEAGPSFPRRFGVRVVRGAEVIQVRDAQGGVISDPYRAGRGGPGRPNASSSSSSSSSSAADSNPMPRGSQWRRTVVLSLDPVQFHADMLANGGAATSAYGDPLSGAAWEAEADGPVTEGVPADGAYSSINVLLRREARGNNFKAVLQMLRDLLNHAAVNRAVPRWMENVLLGRGDPSTAHHSRLAVPKGPIAFHDSFVSATHAAASFPRAASVELQDSWGKVVPLEEADQRLQRPFRVIFEAPDAKASAPAEAPSALPPSSGATGRVVVREAPRRPAGPYGNTAGPGNRVRFTPTQIEAIRAGVLPGLNLVVGPPGTGKTDVAVQIVANLYRSHPSETVLLVTHSNQALNDLFDKIADRGDVDPRHLLRLGRGERDLKSEGDFSRAGRVEHTLALRMAALHRVAALARALGLPEADVANASYSCEHAEYFRAKHVQPAVDGFAAAVRAAKAAARDAVPDEAEAASALPPADTPLRCFPFAAFFADVPGGLSPATVAEQAASTSPSKSTSASSSSSSSSTAAAAGSSSAESTTPPPPLFKLQSFAEDLATAQRCLRHVEELFDDVASFRPFELLRTQRQRVDFMLVKQARIVAMTCTHAAMARRHLLSIGFHFDTLVMEEAAQVMEVETLTPLLLQDIDPAAGAGDRGCSLKRVTLIGDHRQLPPVIVNSALQRYARLEQSLFARLVRLGVPHVQLDAQGRARPAMAALYSWRYNLLADLPNVTAPAPARHAMANAGFAHPFQFVECPDLDGVGESTPSAHFYQNLSEAEFLVATYQYMRLLGYPAHSITMLTTYNGQKALLRDVVARRCTPFPQFGEPLAIETVDKYQGSQNDYVLLSLVRTRAVGHLRDVRRLVVALSRARLGLYVFGRKAVFEGCLELSESFDTLLSRPTELVIDPSEKWPATREADAEPEEESVVRIGNCTDMGRMVLDINSKLRDEAMRGWTEQAAAAAAQTEPDAASGTTATPAAEDQAEQAADKDDGDEVAADQGTNGAATSQAAE